MYLPTTTGPIIHRARLLQFAHVLRFVLDNARPSGDWRTPFELNEPVEAIIAYEDQQLDASLAYILPLFAQANEH